jgi:hypothetical protein
MSAGMQGARAVSESAMPGTPPIACTLSAAELKDREGAWRKLMSSGLVQRDRVPGSIRLRIRFDVTDGSAATMTAEGDGEAVLAGMFLSGC